MQYKRLKRRQLGAFSVEFAIGAMVMFLVTFGIFEISRLIYVINLAESSLRESSRDTRVWEGERSGDLYDQRLTQMFEKKGEIWHLLVDPKRYHLSITYFESLSDLIDDKPSLSQAKQQRSPLAIYEISYQYTPMFFLAGIVEKKISRRILVTMEHEGWPIDEE
ncbi:TadE/TadG family type IV pilus assembly protein [Shewanella woodyi]|uniref:TadE family protein n=1 Tax=Shewanella woodyi (strain ATCC 51908 / MS32) TaxID=392500 RepID=B1KDA7_SHEWM|nr:TadE/TadG family type IV pilus assembly protein [Shewanella woodyi]ACA84908.1 TadE family protein [Shewanella woodyi ATCC 51908]